MQIVERERRNILVNWLSNFRFKLEEEEEEVKQQIYVLIINQMIDQFDAVLMIILTIFTIFMSN